MKHRLRYIGGHPFRLVINNELMVLRRGDVIEVDLKSFSGKRMKYFENLTKKDAEKAIRRKEITSLIREEKQIK